MTFNPITKHVISAAVLLLPTKAFAQSPQTTPLEAAKTVNAFVGQWRFVGQDFEPGAKSAKVTMTLNCVLAALGAAVACNFAGASSEAGKIEAAAVIGYSPDEHIVRWMEISSTGEYHDHRGRWNGNTIQFERLPYTFMGEKFAETLTISFPSRDKFLMEAVTDTKDGPSRLIMTATRR